MQSSTSSSNVKLSETGSYGENSITDTEDHESDIQESARRRLKLLGVTEDEMKRWTALKKMGLTEEDFRVGCDIMTEGATSHDGKHEEVSKSDKLTGYTVSQRRRSKAVNTLGTTEEEIADIRALKLSSLGVHRESDSQDGLKIIRAKSSRVSDMQRASDILEGNQINRAKSAILR
jgi:hypothetical protein